MSFSDTFSSVQLSTLFSVFPLAACGWERSAGCGHGHLLSQQCTLSTIINSLTLVSSYQLLWTSSAVFGPAPFQCCWRLFPFLCRVAQRCNFWLGFFWKQERLCMESVSVRAPVGFCAFSEGSVPSAHAQLHSKGIACRITVPRCLGCPEILLFFLCWLCNFSRVVVLEMKGTAGLLCLVSLPVLSKLKSHKIHTDEFSPVSL